MCHARNLRLPPEPDVWPGAGADNSSAGFSAAFDELVGTDPWREQCPCASAPVKPCEPGCDPPPEQRPPGSPAPLPGMRRLCQLRTPPARALIHRWSRCAPARTASRSPWPPFTRFCSPWPRVRSRCAANPEHREPLPPLPTPRASPPLSLSPLRTHG